MKRNKINKGKRKNPIAARYSAFMAAADAALLSVLITSPVAAADGKAVLKQIIEMLAEWLNIIGGMVMFFGAIWLGLAIYQEDPQQRNKALMTMITGCIVIGITAMRNTIIQF